MEVLARVSGETTKYFVIVLILLFPCIYISMVENSCWFSSDCWPAKLSTRRIMAEVIWDVQLFLTLDKWKFSLASLYVLALYHIIISLLIFSSLLLYMLHFALLSSHQFGLYPVILVTPCMLICFGSNFTSMRNHCPVSCDWRQDFTTH